MNKKVKHKKVTQYTQDEELDISSWLSYRITQIGSVGCRVDMDNTTTAGDYICEDSDGIPYGQGETLQLTFNVGASNAKRVQINYVTLECCE